MSLPQNHSTPKQTAYSQPVTLKNILKFAVPTIVMTLFMSFYTMVDGLFVSNLIGTSALSAIPDRTAHPVCNRHFHHAGYRRKRCDYEKNGRTEKPGSQ